MMGGFRRLVRGRQLEHQLDAELRDHIERQVADHVRSGMSETEARRQAFMALGGLEQTKERCRDVRGTLWLEEMGRDVAYAIRQVRRQPAFWSVVVLTLVLGIAASTSMFAIVNGVLLRSLRYPSADRLVSLAGLSYKGEFLELRQHSRTMDLGPAISEPVSTDSGRAKPAIGAQVSTGAAESESGARFGRWIRRWPHRVVETLWRRGGSPEGSSMDRTT